MAEKEVEKFYSKFAKMYDPFKKIWNIISHNAEEELRTFLTENIDTTKSILELGCGTGDNLGKIISINSEFKSYNIKYKRKYLFDLITVIEIEN